MADEQAFIRVAMCGHVYESPHRSGRVRRFGECDCSEQPKVSSTFQQECLRCGESFWWKKYREYCSERCRRTIERRRKLGVPVRDRVPECERCKQPIEDAYRVSQVRCAGCRGKETPFLEDRTCPTCGGIFTPTRRKQRSCSNRCAQKWYKKNVRVPEPWDDRRRANYQKRRARKLELPSEDIRPIKIYERDGWMCGICEHPVDPEMKWPDPRSPSLDHVKPLSKGGHHIESNVQLAHLECNVSKGDRVLAA